MIEPPVLMSRILAFVLATSVVVLAALAFVLFKMIPLERPEVFFLVNATRSVNVVIKPFDPNTNTASNNNYKEGFIREYVIARNTLNANNTAITKNNWKNIVKTWSDAPVYKAFTGTKTYKSYMFSMQPHSVSCDVSFADPKLGNPILQTNPGDYTVSFAWICKNIGGQTTQNYYKIKIKVRTELDKNISGTLDNLEKLQSNPLGMQVTEYKIQDNKDDPLNSNVSF